jgi:hypothetical protein
MDHSIHYGAAACKANGWSGSRSDPSISGRDGDRPAHKTLQKNLPVGCDAVTVPGSFKKEEREVTASRQLRRKHIQRARKVVFTQSSEYWHSEFIQLRGPNFRVSYRSFRTFGFCLVKIS